MIATASVLAQWMRPLAATEELRRAPRPLPDQIDEAFYDELLFAREKDRIKSTLFKCDYYYTIINNLFKDYYIR